MKTQAIISGWSVLNTGRGIACKYVVGDNVFEVCLSLTQGGDVHIEVHKEAVYEPVMVVNVGE